MLLIETFQFPHISSTPECNNNAKAIVVVKLLKNRFHVCACQSNIPGLYFSGKDLAVIGDQPIEDVLTWISDAAWLK